MRFQTQTTRWALPPTVDAPRHARSLLRAALGSSVDPEREEEAELMLTELVTNSLRHGGLKHNDTIGIELAVNRSSLRVQVVDPGKGPAPAPDRGTPDVYAQGGRGLRIVKALAKDWGLERSGTTRAWFQLPREVSKTG